MKSSRKGPQSKRGGGKRSGKSSKPTPASRKPAVAATGPDPWAFLDETPSKPAKPAPKVPGRSKTFAPAKPAPKPKKVAKVAGRASQKPAKALREMAEAAADARPAAAPALGKIETVTQVVTAGQADAAAEEMERRVGTLPAPPAPGRKRLKKGAKRSDDWDSIYRLKDGRDLCFDHQKSSPRSVLEFKGVVREEGFEDDAFKGFVFAGEGRGVIGGNSITWTETSKGVYDGEGKAGTLYYLILDAVLDASGFGERALGPPRMVNAWTVIR